MRTCTLIASIVAHACAACALVFTTVLATDELPSPRDAATFVNVIAAPPPTVPPPVRARAQPAPNRDTAPLAAPDGVRPEVERPLLTDVGEPVPDGVIGGVGSDAGLGLPSEPPPPPAPVPRPPARVGGVIQAPRKIVDVAPVYPKLAQTAGIGGIVIIEATIDEEGNVRDARVLRSVPLLDAAAAAAVRQWRFTPTVLNGQAIPVLMTVTVNFQMK